MNDKIDKNLLKAINDFLETPLIKNNDFNPDYKKTLDKLMLLLEI